MRRRRGILSEFDLGDKRGIDAPQRVKARNVYIRARNQYRATQARLGPKGQRFEADLSAKIVQSRENLKALLGGKSKSRRKAAGEW